MGNFFVISLYFSLKNYQNSLEATFLACLVYLTYMYEIRSQR